MLGAQAHEAKVVRASLVAAMVGPAVWPKSSEILAELPCNSNRKMWEGNFEPIRRITAPTPALATTKAHELATIASLAAPAGPNHFM